MKLNDLLNKLEAQEQSFLNSEVLSPVLPGRAVTVRIAGVVCRLQPDDPRYQGWAILQPTAMDKAIVMRAATRSEIQKYLQLLPAVHLIAVARPGQTGNADKSKDQIDNRNVWYALPAHKGDQRFKITRPVPVSLCEDSVQPFETIIARFDGSRFWYERQNSRRNPAIAAYLRQSFQDAVPPAELQRKGLSVEEREAYAWAWQSLEEARKNREELRIAQALSHAEGRLVGYIERDDVYTITYRVGNHTHTSTVRKDDLTILTSGICLSGRDHDFDLTSVVGVMREAAIIGHDIYD